MDWSIQDLGAVGELVGSIAVLATLVYLAIQTKQTQKIVLGQSRQAWADSTQTALLATAESAYIAPILAKLASEGFPDDPSAIGKLDSVEKIRYRTYLLGNTHRVRAHLYQLSIGVMDSFLAPPRGMWEIQLRAMGINDVADDLERLYDMVSDNRPDIHSS